MSASRETALAALTRWRKGTDYVADAVDAESKRRNLASRDQGHAMHLALGVARNTGLLDFWISELRDGKLDDRLRDIIRLGLYDVLVGGAAPHAAVNEAVSLTRKRERGVANAILRRSVREADQLKKLASEAGPAILHSHPQFLLDRWIEQFGKENATALCEWNQKPPELYARANRLREKSDEHLQAAKGEAIEGVDGFYRHPFVPRRELEDGFAYIQDPSTRLSVQLLDPKPGETILDACAAPGGKTAYLAELMQNRGKIIATDPDHRRLQRLGENIGSLGIDCAEIHLADWTEPAPKRVADRAPFDAILLDVPCTNTGVMRRRVEVRHRIKPAHFDEIIRLQAELLDAMIPLLAENGRLIYSTCSIDRDENERQVANFLDRHPNWTLESEVSSLPWRDGFDGAYAACLRPSR